MAERIPGTLKLMPAWKRLARQLFERSEQLTEAEQRFVRATAFQGHPAGSAQQARLEDIAARLGDI